MYRFGNLYRLRQRVTNPLLFWYTWSKEGGSAMPITIEREPAGIRLKGAGRQFALSETLEIGRAHV